MIKIVERYRGMKTPKGHDLCVDERENEIVIWYLFWGEYHGMNAHHHMGVARIRDEDGRYVVGWLRGTEQESYRTEIFTSLEKLFSALDVEIAKR
jgi:hypothetical protein